MRIDGQTIGEQDLRRRLSRFLSQGDSKNPRPIADAPQLEVLAILRRLEVAGLSAFFFGGVLRHLLLSPIARNPRDVDVVVDCARNDEIYPLVEGLPTIHNRFGGVRVMSHIPIDMWALNDTWAFKEGLWSARPENLPHTTFFNVEAVVASLEIDGHRGRRIYSSGFFEGMNSRVLELNSPFNPFPALCVVRTVIMARRLNFWVGVKLGEYVVNAINHITDDKIEHAQRSHYGSVYLSAREVRAVVSSIGEQLGAGYDKIAIPGSSRAQWGIWHEHGDSTGVRLHP